MDMNELMLKGIQDDVTKIKENDKDLAPSYINPLIFDKEEFPVGIISRIQVITELKGPKYAFTQGRVCKDLENQKEIGTILDSDC